MGEGDEQKKDAYTSRIESRSLELLTNLLQRTLCNSEWAKQLLIVKNQLPKRKQMKNDKTSPLENKIDNSVMNIL